MRMDDIAVVGAAPWISQPLRAQPERFRAAIYASPFAERIRWWRAYPDPTYEDRQAEAQTATGHEKWLYEEQNVEEYRAIIRSADLRRRYTPPGTLLDSDIIVAFMSDEIRIGDHDLVMPMGRSDGPVPGGVDARLVEIKESVFRAEKRTAQAGTISSSGTVVTGVGTSFATVLWIGAVIEAAGQKRVVSGITSNTRIAVSSAFSPSLDANKYSLCTDQLQHPNVVEGIAIRDASTVYTEGVDFEVGSDGQAIKWLTASCPAPDTYYAAIYRTRPRYIVQFDLGNQSHVVNGVEVYNTVTARLYMQGEVMSR